MAIRRTCRACGKVIEGYSTLGSNGWEHMVDDICCKDKIEHGFNPPSKGFPIHGFDRIDEPNGRYQTWFPEWYDDEDDFYQ